ncbi:MAG: helix-turn-helix transcriptional regulator [Candidatus Dormibacteria bacterium]
MGTFSPARLRARREALGITRDQLGRRVGRTLQTVGYWETGRARPRVHTLHVVARALKCDPADLCERSQ